DGDQAAAHAVSDRRPRRRDEKRICKTSDRDRAVQESGDPTEDRGRWAPRAEGAVHDDESAMEADAGNRDGLAPHRPVMYGTQTAESQCPRPPCPAEGSRPVVVDPEERLVRRELRYQALTLAGGSREAEVRDDELADAERVGPDSAAHDEAVPSARQRQADAGARNRGRCEWSPDRLGPATVSARARPLAIAGATFMPPPRRSAANASRTGARPRRQVAWVNGARPRVFSCRGSRPVFRASRTSTPPG